MDEQHQHLPAGLLARIATGVPTGDAEVDAACSTLLATGMSPRAIVAILLELARSRPLARTA